MLLRRDGSYLCVGTLVHPRMVVTAAHCLAPVAQGTPSPLVRVGPVAMSSAASGAPRGYVSRAIIHAKYRAASFDFDVAVLLLRGRSTLPLARQAHPSPHYGRYTL